MAPVAALNLNLVRLVERINASYILPDLLQLRSSLTRLYCRRSKLLSFVIISPWRLARTYSDGSRVLLGDLITSNCFLFFAHLVPFRNVQEYQLLIQLVQFIVYLSFGDPRTSAQSQCLGGASTG